MTIELIFKIFMSLMGLIVALGGTLTYLSGRDTSGWAWKCAVWAIISIGLIFITLGIFFKRKLFKVINYTTLKV